MKTHLEFSHNNTQHSWELMDWDAFDPALHFEPLRKYLTELEAQDGIGKVHQQVTQKLMEMGMELRHLHLHQTEDLSFAMSPDGKYFASGNEVGGNYEDGGHLMIWEVASGKPVSFYHVEGGVGFDGCGGALKWSPDSKSVGINYQTNFISNYFLRGQDVPSAEIAVTNGWDSAPGWCWGSDSQHIAVFCYGDSVIPLCIADLNDGNVREMDARWMAKTIPDPILTAMGEDPEYFEGEKLDPFDSGAFSDDMQVFYTDYKRGALAINVELGEVIYFLPDVDPNWNKNGTLMIVDGQVYNGLTGELSDLKVVNDDVVWSNVEPNIAAIRVGAGFEIWDVVNSKLLNRISSESLGLDTTIQSMGGFEWSPDGKRMAIYLGNNSIAIAEVFKKGPAIYTYTFPEPFNGVYFGGDNNLLGYTDTNLQFMSLNDGKVYSTCSFPNELENWVELHGNTPHPLQHDDEDYGEDFNLHPAYAMSSGKETVWTLVFETGLVVAPKAVHPKLDDHLFYVFQDRWGWPYRWGKTPVVEQLTDAIGHPLLPLSAAIMEELFPAAAKKEVGPQSGLLETSEKGLEDFVAAFYESLALCKNLHEKNVQIEIREARQEIALLQFAQGQLKVALDTITQIDAPALQLQTHAQIGMELMLKGEQQVADEIWTIIQPQLKEAAQMEDKSSYLIGFAYSAGFAKLLGLEELSLSLFQLSEAVPYIGESGLQLLTELIRVYYKCGDKDKVEALLKTENLDPGYDAGMLIDFLEDLGKNGNREDCIRYVKALIPTGMDFSYYGVIDDIVLQYIMEEQKFSEMAQWQADLNEGSSFEVALLLELAKIDLPKAITLVRKKIKENIGSTKSFLFWAEILSKMAAKEMDDIIDQLESDLEKLQNIYDKEHYLRAYATVMCRAGKNDHVKTLLTKPEMKQHTLALLLGILKYEPSKANQNAVIDYYQHNPNSKTIIKYWQALWQQDRIPEANEVREAALEATMVKGLDKHDRRSLCWKILNGQLEIGAYQEAYQTALRFKKAFHKDVYARFARECATLGWTDEALALLLKANSTNFYDRPRAILGVIRSIYGKNSLTPFTL